MHFSNFSGTLGLNGKRHCPSLAIVAFKRFPFLSVITKQVGLLNNLDGSESQNHISKTKTTHHLSFCFLVRWVK